MMRGSVGQTGQPSGPASPNRGVATVSLSLVSHTNVGKTTLARTLLGRDIGEVRDEAHVTGAVEAHVLLQAERGERLLLWDTPGFGDSLRLARRLAQAGNPLGWLLSQVWDRWRDRPFWASQQAIRQVMDQTDVVLYLVNASESPEDAAYLAPELQVLALLGKPVVALLNQTGPAGSADEPALVTRWQAHLGTTQVVRAVLPLDAFTRCWVQEAVLWRAVAGVLPPPQQVVLARVQAQWWQVQQARWHQAMDELARRLSRAALDTAGLPDAGWRGTVQGWGQTLGKALGWRAGDAAASATEQAMAQLAERLDDDVRSSTDRLIALHGLQGEAGRAVLDQLARHYAVQRPLDEGRAALWGGLVTGALAGLKADIASGGLTLGGGLLAGGVIGALGAAGAVRGVNRVRGVEHTVVAWDESVLQALVANALLGYLAVAHHGRGRGAWVALAPPPAWLAAVDAVLVEQATAWAALWQSRPRQLNSQTPGQTAEQAAWHAQLAGLLRAAGHAMLQRLYPDAVLGLAWRAPAATDGSVA